VKKTENCPVNYVPVASNMLVMNKRQLYTFSVFVAGKQDCRFGTQTNEYL